MCCCRPVGSPPPLSDSPLQGRRPTDPEQQGDAMIQDSYSRHTVQCISIQRPGTLYFSKESLTSSRWATMSLVCMLYYISKSYCNMSAFKSSATSQLTSTEIEECTYFYCCNGNYLGWMCSVLTFESSCCVRSSSSPFFVLLSEVWTSSSLFTERGSRSEAVVPVVSLMSGGEELRDVCRRNSSMANL